MEKARKRQLWTAAIIILAVAAIIACVCLVLQEQKLDDLQNAALSELENRAGEYDPQSIVLYDTSPSAAEKLAEMLGASLRISKNGEFATLSLPEGTTIQDVFADERNKSYIPQMSADWQVKASELENTLAERIPARPSASVNDPSFSLQTYLDYLNLGSVWNTTKGSGVTVAIIDTGIDTSHPEFAGRISEYSYNATYDKIVKDYLADDGVSYDWSLVEDEQGHGTSVAGALAAGMDNGEGIVGVAPEVTLIIIKAECDANGGFTRTSDLVFGLYYAIERDVDVVNMSFGTSGSINPFAAATQLAVDSDIICVAAAGNDGSAALFWPAADENVIGVGALAEDSWELAPYSNYGDNVNIVAPGTTYTAKMGGGYDTVQGTSLASPLAAGTLALYLANNRYTTFDDVCEVLYASSYDLGDLGADWDYGFGAIDASALLLEERGTITYDMLTDELENETGLFIRNHTLQALPEPERLYAVFDGWYYDPQCTEEYVYYEDRFVTDLTLYAHWVNEDDGVPYTYVELDDGTIEIRSYTGRRKYITIPEKIDGKIVSSIGDFAFSGESDLREVWLPSGLTHIGRYAFKNCSNLLHIDIPEGVTAIEEGAFYNGVRLSYVAFAGNSSLKAIGDLAFAYCSKLSRFEIPAGVTVLNGSAFVGTLSMQSFSVRANNTAFTAINGVLCNRTASVIVACPAARTGNEALPVTVCEIGPYAFAYTKRTAVSLDGIETIGACAFYYAALESVVIPDSVTVMGKYAFGCNAYLKSATIGNGLTSIPVGTFSWAFMLREIVIPANVGEIGDFAFASCEDLTRITFAENGHLMVIGKGAFSVCALTDVEIPASVISIGEGAFGKNYYLSEVTFAADSNLVDIGSAAFEDTVSLTAITFPARLETLGERAFENSGLSGTVMLPASLKTFGAGAFAYCASLTAFAVEEGNAAYRAVDGVLYTIDGLRLMAYPTGNVNTSYTVFAGTENIAPRAFEGAEKLLFVTLPESLTTIEEYGMAGVVNLRSIAIPDRVVQIARRAFMNDLALTSVTFGENSQLPRVGYEAFAYCGLTSFRMPANVSTMAQGAFFGCDKLRTFTFAANSKLESISAYVFDGCVNLQRITFEPGSALTSIQAHGLEGMRKLTMIDLGDAKLTNIDNFAFRFCESLTSFTVPAGVTNIGRFAFYGCAALTSMQIPASMERIGAFAFLGTEKLNVYFAAETLPPYLDEDWDHGIGGYYLGVTNVTIDGDWTYANLASGGVAIISYTGSKTAIDLTTLSFGGDIVNIGGGAFAYSTVESIVLPETLVTIQAEAFYHSALQGISIPAGVEFIGRSAFANTPITTLTLAPDANLTVIEQSAFENTKVLGSVTLPASLTTMGRAAFKNSGITVLNFAENIALTEIADEAFAYTGITALALPAGVTEIGDGAFRGTEKLKTVSFGTTEELTVRSSAFYQAGLEELTIPANMSYIGEYAFVSLANLTDFAVEADHPYYKAVDGLLVSKDGRKLVAAPAGRTGSLTVPVELEVIGFGAFENTALSSITFPAEGNILSFGYRAFCGARNLTEIHIPQSVVAIDYYAFANCTALTKVTFAEGNQLRGVYEGAFCGCMNLSEISLPDSVVEISDFAFYGCAKLTSLPVSGTRGIKGIYSYAMAYTGLTELALPASVIDLGNYAFMGVPLTSITLSDEGKQELIIGLGAFRDCNELTEITLPFVGASFEDPAIAWLGYIFGAGSYMANNEYIPASLKIVNITEGLTTLGEGAFYDTYNLERINLPKSLTMVSSWSAFGGTNAYYELNLVIPSGTVKIKEGQYGWLYGLRSVTLPDTVEVIESGAFYACTHLISISLPEGLERIEESAFRSCRELTEITIPSTVKYIASGQKLISFSAFDDCSQLQVVRNNSALDIRLGSQEHGGVAQYASVLIDKEGNYHYLDEASRLEYIDTSDGFRFVKENGEYKLIRYFGSEADVRLPEEIEGHPYTLYRFDGAESVTVPGSAIIGEYAFTGSNVRTVVILDGVTSIGERAFEFCESLVSIKLPDSLVFIGELAFSNCSLLREIKLPDSIEELGFGAFQGCNSLAEIELPSGLFKLPENAFANCRALKEIRIPDSVTQVGVECFSDCSALETVYIGAGLQSLGGMFSELLSYSVNPRIIISESNPYITSTEEGVLSKDGKVFMYCNKDVTSYAVPQGVTKIEAGAFSGCTRLVEVVIPDGVTEIGDYAFSGCSSLREILLPDSVSSLGVYAFAWCEKLEKAVLPENLAVIQNGAFYECSSLADVSMPKNVEFIGSQAFWDCLPLSSLTIPAKLTFFDLSAVGYTSIESLHIPAGITEIYNIAGSSLQNLSSITVDEGNAHYRAVGNCLFEKNGTEILLGCKNSVIPEFAQSIGEGAFAGKGMVRITLPANIQRIANQAFSGNSSLQEIVNFSAVTLGAEHGVSGRVKVLTTEAESDLIKTEAGFVFRSVNEQWQLVAYDGHEKDIVLPSAAELARYGIETYVIASEFNIPQVRTLVIPDCVTEIRDLTFQQCCFLESVSIPDSVTYIGVYSFRECIRLKEITLPDTITYLGDEAFYLTAYYNDPENWDDGCLYLQKYLLAVEKDVKRVTVRNDTLAISTSAFLGCYALKHVTISGSWLNTLNGLSNIETLVVADSLPDHPIKDYFGANVPLTLQNVVFEGALYNQDPGRLMEGISGIRIYVSKDTADCAWNKMSPGWNQQNAVVYGEKWITAEFYSDEGEWLDTVYYTTWQVIRMPRLSNYAEGAWRYVFQGYDTNGDGLVDAMPVTSSNDIVANAVYVRELACKDGHTPSNWIVDAVASCESKGSRHKECTVCKEMIETEEIPAAGHTPSDWIVDAAASCESKGSRHKECTVCKKTIETEEIPAVGHTPSDWIVDASASCERSRYKVCMVCKETIETEELPAAAHTPSDWIVDVPADTRNEGTRHKECVACGKILEYAVIEKVKGSSGCGGTLSGGYAFAMIVFVALVSWPLYRKTKED